MTYPHTLACRLTGFDVVKAAVVLDRLAAGERLTDAAAAAGLKWGTVAGWARRADYPCPLLQAFARSYAELLAARRAAKAERTAAAAGKLRDVLRDRLLKHFERADVRRRVEQAGVRRLDYWAAIGLIESRLFPDDGEPDAAALVPARGHERVAPRWMTDLAARMAGPPGELPLPTP